MKKKEEVLSRLDRFEILINDITKCFLLFFPLFIVSMMLLSCTQNFEYLRLQDKLMVILFTSVCYVFCAIYTYIMGRAVRILTMKQLIEEYQKK